jgi:ubiquinone/menaquinone biosynthesis C-methylase UbiE
MSDPIIVNNESLENTFDEAAPQYDPNGFFRLHGQRLVDLLPINLGNKVLDIATGCGAVLLPAAIKVGLNGRVIGIDISAKMLQRTQLLILTERINNVDLAKMDGGHLLFADASFDVVTCGFAMFFLPVTGLDEMYRVCKPGGKLGLTVFGKSVGSKISCKEILEGLIREYGIKVEYTMPLPAYYTPEEIQVLLSNHGFIGVTPVQDTKDTVYTNLEDYWKVVMSAGNRITFSNLNEASKNSFKADLFTRLKVIMEPDGLHQQSSVVYVTCQKTS